MTTTCVPDYRNDFGCTICTDLDMRAMPDLAWFEIAVTAGTPRIAFVAVFVCRRLVC